MEARERKQQEHKKAADEKEQCQSLFMEACKLRSLAYRNTGKTSYKLIAPKYDYNNFYDAANHELHWSVLILYPEYNASDFVMDWNEFIGVWDMLATMFPSLHEEQLEGKDSAAELVQLPAWDSKRAYYLENLQVFVENGNGEKFKIEDLHLTLGDVLSTCARSIDGLPVLVIETKQQQLN